MNAHGSTNFRRHTPFLLVGAGIISLLALLFMLAWWLLPHWAPQWVMRYSPWVSPVIRAYAGSNDVDAFTARISEWGESTIPQMESVLRTSTDTKERWAALIALGEILTPRTVPGLILALNTDDVESIQYAAGNLEYLNDPTALEPLIASLRRLPLNDAVPVAGHIDGISHPAKFDLISRTLLTAPEEWLQGLGCLSLPSCDDPRVLPTLVAHLGRHQSSDEEDDAGYALGQIDSPEARSAIVQAFSDVDERRRYGAIVAAVWAAVCANSDVRTNGTTRQQVVYDLLLPHLIPLTGDRSTRVQMKAVKALAIFDEDQRAQNALLGIVRNGGTLALAVLDNGGLIDSELFGKLMVVALTSHEAAVRLHALKVLHEEYSDLSPDHEMHVERLLNDPDPAVAELAQLLRGSP